MQFELPNISFLTFMLYMSNNVDIFNNATANCDVIITTNKNKWILKKVAKIRQLTESKWNSISLNISKPDCM